MRKKNLIVFDIDGTLTDSVKQHQKAFTEMLYEVGAAEINSEFKTFKHHTDTFIAKEIYENTNQIPFSEAKIIEFEQGLTEKISCSIINEIRGAKKLIELLENETDFGVCFATGSLRRPAKFKLKSIGISFDEKQLVASDKIHEREKIVATAIDNASEYYNVEKFERIISLGDGLWDLITARNLGLEFIGVGLKNKKVLIENGAETVYKNLTEFELVA
ncbi:HAD family hydrolase [Patiriisocius sp. Uisw_047]|uniref:HAD family hydrolase n=1 Tax=Patiriisocius sp. Uisw_047 TaxID=3230969 RepID=UPI0039E8D09D